MRLTVWILLLLSSVSLLSGFIFLSCEETLEVCPACGEIANGNSEIIGDPRIDNTFAAVQNLRAETIRMSRRADQALDNLLKIFGASPGGSETKISALKRAVDDFITSSTEPPFDASITFGKCAVDRKFADRAQNICEAGLCSINRPTSTGLCRGLSEGSCINSTDGICFQPSSGYCSGNCAGACNEATEERCPGDCFGTCNGPCLAHDPNGACAGICNGNCTGICVSSLPFNCAGQCEGACGNEVSDGGCNETDTFVGTCNETSENSSCRGQYYPEGCGAKCLNCSATAQDCRESAKFLAWSRLACSAAEVRVIPRTSTGIYDPSAILKIGAMESYLAPIADDFAGLSLLLDGMDLRSDTYLGDAFESGEDSPLDDAADQYYDFSTQNPGEPPPVDLERAYLPVEALKARVYWLLRVSLNSTGGFRVTAGNFDCLEPALNDAASLMLTMAPVIREEMDNTVSFTADTACTSLETPLDEAVPCLYHLLELQTELLALLNADSTP